MQNALVVQLAIPVRMTRSDLLAKSRCDQIENLLKDENVFLKMNISLPTINALQHAITNALPHHQCNNKCPNSFIFRVYSCVCYGSGRGSMSHPACLDERKHGASKGLPLCPMGKYFMYRLKRLQFCLSQQVSRPPSSRGLLVCQMKFLVSTLNQLPVI